MKIKLLILLAIFLMLLVSCEKEMKWVNPYDPKADTSEISGFCSSKGAECGQIDYEFEDKTRKIFCGECGNGYECRQETNKCEKTDESGITDPTNPTDEPTNPTDEPTNPTDEPTNPTDEPTDDDPTDPTDDDDDPTDDTDNDTDNDTDDDTDDDTDNDTDNDTDDDTDDDTEEPDDDSDDNPCGNGDPIMSPNPCAGVTNSTGVCIKIDSTTYSCACVDGYYWWGTEIGCIDKRRLTLGNICTGQNKCYNNEEEITCPASPSGTDDEYNFYGQDAQHTNECTPQSFTVKTLSSQKVVFDNNTGLMWQQTMPSDKYTWENAVSYCDGLTFAEYSDWRLPTPLEFLTIVDNSKYASAIDQTYFPNIPKWDEAYNLWTSNENLIDDSSQNFDFYPYIGAVGAHEKIYPLNVMCVRGNEFPASTFTTQTISGNDVVTDLTTGLMWQKTISDSTIYKWSEALEYCENLSYADYTDWRLPNKNELTSLLTYNRSETPYSDFPDMLGNWFVSSTTCLRNTGSAWAVEFATAAVACNSGKNVGYYVRCVRDGNNLNTGDTSGNQAQTGTVGAACTNDSQCTQTYGSGDDVQIAVCLTQSVYKFPGGYCTFNCDKTDHAACDNADGVYHENSQDSLGNGYCYHKCTKPSDCRVGYRCSNKIHACLPDCEVNECVYNTVCDETDKVCL